MKVGYAFLAIVPDQATASTAAPMRLSDTLIDSLDGDVLLVIDARIYSRLPQAPHVLEVWCYWLITDWSTHASR